MKGAAQASWALGGAQSPYSLCSVNTRCQLGLKILIFGILKLSFGFFDILCLRLPFIASLQKSAFGATPAREYKPERKESGIKLLAPHCFKHFLWIVPLWHINGGKRPKTQTQDL